MTSTVPAGSWRKSSYSSGSSPDCVEVGHGRQAVGVRDTKDRTGGTIVVSRTAWVAFVGSVTTR